MVLEDLFIGLTKSSAQSLNYLPSLFSEPLENLKSHYFSTFGHGWTTSPNQLAINAVLESQ